MRSGWFGDRYDHLKWSVLLHLAAQDQTILYVVMLRDTNEKQRAWKSCDPKVVQFFESIAPAVTKQPIERIEELDSRIKLFADELPVPGSSRAKYLGKLRTLLNVSARPPYCVFLDPDTGLSKKPSGEHMSYAELRDVWAVLKSKDMLVVYQHG